MLRFFELGKKVENCIRYLYFIKIILVKNIKEICLCKYVILVFCLRSI